MVPTRWIEPLGIQWVLRGRMEALREYQLALLLWCELINQGQDPHFQTGLRFLA